MRKNTWRVRGLSLGLVGCDEQTAQNLEQQCLRLGMKTRRLAAFSLESDSTQVDALIFDSDNPDVNGGDALSWPALPRIALLGNETPSRLQWVIAQGIDGHMRKPVRYDGLLTAVSLALHNWQNRQSLEASIQKMEERLKARRFVFSAQLLLMRHFALDENSAYSRLRTLAMEQQKTVEQFSIELVSQPEIQLGALGGK
ncbi:ANTAR domain-containing response regulator [Mangrovibacter plantisponsor]|uniref:AmiR/NasT family two-component response regulator n=1 Tax=Mangrovibacter plantisponsor TaxID=451513 RepID=A0A317Q4Y5_9ENTR|nr:ANTAR domain-containing protein [Mangrovibacter plantisponsor]PWW11644.1 AmiR/NasT family two-component response regulator [Mangrovibacter plantisponsor]